MRTFGAVVGFGGVLIAAVVGVVGLADTPESAASPDITVTVTVTPSTTTITRKPVYDDTPYDHGDNPFSDGVPSDYPKITLTG